MADTERRDYRGGRFNRKKRGREEDNEDSYGRRPQRPRQEAPPGTRLRRGLLDVAEDIREPEEAVQQLAQLAADNADDEYVRETLCVVALKLVSEQPFKIPFVAAVVLQANRINGDVAIDVVEKAGQQLQKHLDAGEWRAFKLVLRFLACLRPLFEADGVFPILAQLLDVAVELQTASADDTLGLELVRIILLTLPYLMAAAKDEEALREQAIDLLQKTDVIASNSGPVEALVDPYPINEDDKPMACPSLLSILQRQLLDEANNNWPLTCIPRLCQDTDGEARRHTFPAISIPAQINPGSQVIFPELFFSLYADHDIETVPSTAQVASSLFRDAVRDTVDLLDFNRNVTARLLNSIDAFWAPGHFVKRSTAFDKLQSLQEAGKPTWRPEDVVIDAIFSQMLQLPAPEHKVVYYHSLITESCKISPGGIAPSLGRAIRFLFRNIEFMDMELSYRFMDWFAHHLSNFDFRWKWAEWVPELELPDIHPRKAFIIGALEKEVQLSFARRVRDTLPEAMHSLIPAQKEVETPDFKYDNDIPFAAEGRKVMALLRKKRPDEEVQAVLSTLEEAAAAQGEDPTTVATDVYMTSICFIGSKSLSHVLSTIDRCQERLQAMVRDSEAARRQVISSVVDFWHDHPGTAVNIIGKLLNYTIVTPSAVVDWVLGDRLNGGRALATLQVWDLVSVTMDKVVNRMRQLTEEASRPDLDEEQVQQIEAALPKERAGMGDLFRAIEDGVRRVAEGEVESEGTEEEVDLVRQWGARWECVWRRKAAVEGL
ncbi:hypothetical protein K470DRAFT_244427 [Piedraia hortae CBS 480.64]|uniref:Cap binding protein n=1 Tax=Piedraia hortae CBS 480.64 TaxID=1314780 RepID=A0A6A7C4C6_9PEZI|nr:hypothetical protein K470DRAFT_244427 [Piedraia hortae CBS 480.64]